MFPEPRVAGTPGGVEVPKPPMPAEGVPVPAPVVPVSAPAPVAPADVPSQPVDAEAEWNARLAKEREAVEVKWKRDMDRLRSQEQSTRARELAQRDREIDTLRRQQEADIMSRMTVDERKVYEEEQLRERATQFEQQYTQERQAREALTQMVTYGQRLANMGVDIKDLDYTDPDSFFRSADERFETYIRDLQSYKAGQHPAAPVTPASTVPVPGRPTPPQVVTSTGTPPAQLTPVQAFDQLKKTFSQQAGRELSEEEVWRLFESKQYDLNKHIPLPSQP